MHHDQIATNPGLAVPVAPARSVVSWGAVLAGAAIGAALSAMLVAGGGGLGFLAMSPWSHEGASAPALTIGAIIWLMLTQVLAFGLAGYVAGRLRAHWRDTASDEVYFRDTAHGLLVWAVGTLVGVVLLGSLAASVISGTARAGAALAGAGAGAAAAVAGDALQAGADQFSLEDFTDTLLRPADPAQAGQQADVREEVSRLLTRSVMQGNLQEADLNYLSGLIAQRTGVDEAAARKRITEIVDQAKQAIAQAEQAAREAADTARKAAAAFSLWAFASMLLGAFIAALAATMGGRARDSASTEAGWRRA